jgi:hypothetical protein
MTTAPLSKYRKKRHFDATPEPTPRSVVSNRLLFEIARDEGGNVRPARRRRKERSA